MVPDDRVVERGTVPHGARYHPLGRHPQQHLAGLRAVGSQAPAGLEADESVAGGGDSDRPATVVGPGGRNDAGGHRRTGSARRAAWRVPDVPRVAGRAPIVGFRDTLGAEFGRIGHPENHQARVQKPLRDQRVPVGHLIGQRARPARRGKAAVLLAEVFEQEGNTGKRALQARIGGPGVGDTVEATDDGVQVRVHRVRSLPCQRE